MIRSRLTRFTRFGHTYPNHHTPLARARSALKQHDRCIAP